MGDRYPHGMINVIPDAALESYGQIPKLPISIRMDLLFNEEGLAHNLQRALVGAATRFEEEDKEPVFVVTNKPINPQILSHFRRSIRQITYIIEEDNEPNFIRFLMNNAIPYSMISFMPKEKLDPLKLDYMDFGVLVEQKKPCREDIEDKLEDTLLHYKSNKFVLSEGKIYNSLASWKRGLDTNELVRSPQPIIDDPLLWEESDNYCFLSLTES